VETSPWRSARAKLKASLHDTNAPAVVVRHADGRPGVVDFPSYTVPEAPDKGAYDVVQGLWPHLALTGTDSQVGADYSEDRAAPTLSGGPTVR
jgi:hypothetical protein